MINLCGMMVMVFMLNTVEATRPRHCRNRNAVQHLHLSVGHDPSTQMMVSFATASSSDDKTRKNKGNKEDDEPPPPIAGIRFGTSPDRLDRFVGEQEYSAAYESTLPPHENFAPYRSPYQHHILLDSLEPLTRYYYRVEVGDRGGTRNSSADDEMQNTNKSLQEDPIQPQYHQRQEEDKHRRHNHNQNRRNETAEDSIQRHSADHQDNDGKDATRRYLRWFEHIARRTGERPYDGHENP